MDLQEDLNRKCGDDAMHAFGIIVEGQAMVIQEFVAERLGCPRTIWRHCAGCCSVPAQIPAALAAPQRCRRECRVFIGWEPPI